MNAVPEDVPPPAFAPLPAAEARLLEQLRRGDAEAGRQLVRDYYPGVYRYLLYLTGRPDRAEDLTQETFLQAWRRLETFEGRAPLRLWLHRIAHREFLQALRRQRPETPLEEIAEPPAPPAADWTEALELRDAIRKLPLEEGEVVVLHYLHGYNCQEIAQIVRAPVTTVKYRLMTARGHLQRELGEGDLVYLNPPSLPMRQWAWLPLDRMRALETRMSTKGERTMSDKSPAGMSRRKLLETAGTAAATAAAGLTGPAAMASQNPADIIDDRLTRKVALAAKATALSDLCAQLQATSGVRITAGPSVADEKVTLLCKGLPLRDVMRQLSHPFGYTWLRTRQSSGVSRQSSGEGPSDSHDPRLTPHDSYRYELAQDLRSQLLEEELRNRDRNAALLALERDLERYRPYLDLTPDEIVERAQTASGEEKKLLENIGGGGWRSDLGWGPIQMYFRLTSDQMAALRAGEELQFREEPRPGDLLLPKDIARSILQGWRQEQIIRRGGEFTVTSNVEDPDSVPVHTVPELRATLTLTLRQTELGQYGLGGDSGFRGPNVGRGDTREPYAVGMSPAVLNPDNAIVNAKLARDPALRGRVTVEPRRDLTPRPPSLQGKGESPGLTRDDGATALRLPSPSRGGAGGGVGSEPKLTTADVLEALHHATGMPIVADFYTRLYQPEALTAHDQPLFEALNHLADTMRLRWHKEDRWLQFRSTSFYDDRMKEVPNRLLSRWATVRREHGVLMLDDLVEIAGLTDAQLKAGDMAEGAKEIWGLAEWDLARNHKVLWNLRFLAQLTSEQRREAESPTGLAFTKMTLAQQQGFLVRALAAQSEGIQSLAELEGAAVRVDYTQPGWYEWRPAGTWWLRWIVPQAPGPDGRRDFRPPVRERTREAALEALRRVDPETRAAVLAAAVRHDPRLEKAPPTEEEQIVPTDLSLATIYMPDNTNRHELVMMSADNFSSSFTW